MAESMGLVASWLQPIGAAWVATALAICIGLVLVHDALAPAAAARVPRFARRATWLLGLGLAAWLLAATQAMTDARPAELPAALWLVLTQTSFGRTASVGLVAWLVLALIPAEPAVDGRTTAGSNPLLQLAALVALAYALAASGHVADRGLLGGAALVNTLHVLGAGAWVGVVAIGAINLRQWPAWTPPERSRLAHRLSRVATVAVPLALLSGVANGVRMLGSAEHPMMSPYFQLLAAKVLMVGLAVALGLWNRWSWLKRLDRGEDTGAASFAAVLIVEVQILVLVVIMAARLAVTMPPD